MSEVLGARRSSRGSPRSHRLGIGSVRGFPFFCHGTNSHTDPEIESQPRYFKDAGFNVVKIPILSGSIKSMMANVPTVSDLYQSMIASSPTELAQSIAAIATATQSGAALVHCTAGKDRTGVVIALTQALLGVSDDDIVANYVQTQANLQGAWLAKMEANMKDMMAKVPDSGSIDMAAVAALVRQLARRGRMFPTNP
ncbi:tyrosine-protein phosphatase [Schaalia sp. JY-X169]|uniref:tyrosine-protein phosphatase n=1 Tax=Schaalia sp. JY-X169 TaxID=2758572 RepID=UPI0015F35AD0|nr:tyrosine-protein phosphatase [Schaalia sp. JY-X169]